MNIAAAELGFNGGDVNISMSSGPSSFGIVFDGVTSHRATTTSFTVGNASTYTFDLDNVDIIKWAAQSFTALSIGASNNDKLVTQGYVDDTIASSTLWNRSGVTLSPATAGDGVAVNDATVDELAGQDNTIAITDANGRLKDSPVTIETAPAGGSMLGLEIYNTEPVAPTGQSNMYAYYNVGGDVVLAISDGVDVYEVTLAKV
jgi:hypothetical protein